MTEFTLEELKERLSRLDEVMLLELLEINSSILVEAFEDIIIERQVKLRGILDE